MIRIVVDAMGSDSHPTPDVEGAVQAAREYGVEIILVGDETIIKPVLEKQNTEGLTVRIVDAPEMLSMEDKGEKLVLKARSKDAKNSMAVGIDLVKNGEADAFVSAGNTGAGIAQHRLRHVHLDHAHLAKPPRHRPVGHAHQRRGFGQAAKDIIDGADQRRLGDIADNGNFQPAAAEQALGQPAHHGDCHRNTSGR